MPLDDPNEDVDLPDDGHDEPVEPPPAAAMAVNPDHGSELDALSAQFGTPARDAPFWHPQSGDYTCTVEAQAGILESIKPLKFSPGDDRRRRISTSSRDAESFLA